MNLNFPDNLTEDEQKEFTSVNLIAHNVLRNADPDTHHPCWLCMSDEAKQESREMAATWYNLHKRPLMPVAAGTEDEIFRFERVLLPIAGPMIQQWIMAEAEFKRLRVEENNPRTFFAPAYACPCEACERGDRF
jgi:hypothetical protein